jgi:sporulation protein YlmC with PRC-barrel domain
MESMQFTIGADAMCRDGGCGKVIRVVIDPLAKAVTHIVVEPEHRQGLGRLVPLAVVHAATTDQVELDCTSEELAQFDQAEETHFLPASAGSLGYVATDVLSLPYYGLGPGNISPPLTEDRLPLGEVAVRRDEYVRARDGAIGRVHALVIDPRDRHVTHLLLQEGHLWGKKEVAIPISAVSGIDEDGISLTLSKQEIQDLPAVDVTAPS